MSVKNQKIFDWIEEWAYPELVEDKDQVGFGRVRPE